MGTIQVLYRDGASDARRRSVMGRARLVLVLAVFALLLLAAPSRAALEKKITFTVNMPEMPGGNMILEDKPPPQMSHRVQVGGTAQGFACADKATVVAQIRLVAAAGQIPLWAQASMNPENLEFEINQLEPGVAETKAMTVKTSEILVEIGWDVETRPTTDAHFSYIIKTDQASLRSGNCQPGPLEFVNGNFTIHVRMPDVNETVRHLPPECRVTPFPTDNPVCALAEAQNNAANQTLAPKDSPATGLLAVLAGGILAAAWLPRRRT